MLPDLFFSDEPTFYLDKSAAARGLRARKTIYMQNKGRKLGHGLQLFKRKTLMYLDEQNIKTQNYFKVLEEAIVKTKELRDISRDVLSLQIDNARYHWQIEALEFYYENI